MKLFKLTTFTVCTLSMAASIAFADNVPAPQGSEQGGTIHIGETYNEHMQKELETNQGNDQPDPEVQESPQTYKPRPSSQTSGDTDEPNP